MGWTCGTSEFWWGKLNKRGHLEDMDLVGRVIFNWILKKQDWRVWNGFTWPTIGTMIMNIWVPQNVGNFLTSWGFAVLTFQDGRSSVEFSNESGLTWFLGYMFPSLNNGYWNYWLCVTIHLYAYNGFTTIEIWYWGILLEIIVLCMLWVTVNSHDRPKCIPGF
jgi:hypothetical protein